MEDFVPIDRDIVNHWIYKDAEYFKVWFEMLHRARYAEDPKVDIEKGQVYTINQGEFMFGRPSWSARLGISEQRLKTLMKKLIAFDMISLTISYRYFSIYRLTNYEKYRKSNQQNNQQKHLEPQGIEEDSNHLTNLLSTSCQPAANLLSTTKEERSNTEVKKKEEKKSSGTKVPRQFIKPSLDEIAEYCMKRNNQVDAEYFYSYYESKGWVVGKSPMKDWKAAVITWEKNSYSTGKTPFKTKTDEFNEQMALLKQQMGGTAYAEAGAARSRKDITPDQDGLSEFYLEPGSD